MNVKKINLRSLSPPPPTFNMQTIQKELSRLTRDHTEFEEKLQEHKVKADAVDELFIYAQHSVQRHKVDQSALLNGSPTLTERLAMCNKDMGFYPFTILFTFHYLAFVSHDSFPYLSVVSHVTIHLLLSFKPPLHILCVRNSVVPHSPLKYCK